jgi:hypothetical protein
VKEVFRWQPVVPLGVPHRLSADDVHDGYFIPKGSIVIPNIWKMTHDERAYERPMQFRPERFLGEHPERDPRELVFGFGRRCVRLLQVLLFWPGGADGAVSDSVCPGSNLADTSVWLACAMSLAVFCIAKARDAHGREITPEPEMTSGTISHPRPFECAIKPRSERHDAMIRAVELPGA